MSTQELNNNIHTIIQNAQGQISLSFQMGEDSIAINDRRQLRAASVIKIPILIEAFRQIENGKINPDNNYPIKNYRKVAGTGVLNYLSDSSSYTFKNLLELMIIVSDNTASNIVLDSVGFENVRETSKLINSTEMRLERYFMDEKATKLGFENTISAHEMVQFLKIINEPNNLLSDHSRKEILKILNNQQFTQKLPAFNNANLELTFYNKTGELLGVEHDVSIIKRMNKTAYIAVLSDNWTYNNDGQQVLAQIGKTIINHMVK